MDNEREDARHGGTHQAVLYSAAVRCFACNYVSIQAFLGRVELTHVKGLNSESFEILDEFPALSPQDARALAENVSHAARRNPYRLRQPDDAENGFSILRTESASFTCAPIADDPQRIKFYALSEPSPGEPGALSTVPSIRAQDCLRISDAMMIAASCALSGTPYRANPEAGATAMRAERNEQSKAGEIHETEACDSMRETP